jgi:hypothetical protein
MRNKGFDFNSEYPVSSTTLSSDLKTYADGLVVGLLDDRGNYNASSNLFPSSGGSGPSGTILKGDTWNISVAGTLGGQIIVAGDWIRALTNSPGQTASNWTITQTGIKNVVSLVDAATIATDTSLGNVFKVTLGGNRTLGAPTNPSNGQKVVWRFKQDGTGSRTITLDPIFRVPLSIDTITLSTTSGYIDYLGAIYNADDLKWDIIAFVRGIF